MEVELNLAQAKQLVEFFGGDDSQVVVQQSETGHAGPGLYVHCKDYPDEGAAFLAPISD